MFTSTSIDKVTIQTVMTSSTLLIFVGYVLFPTVTLSMLNSQSLISSPFSLHFLLQKYPFHGMHTVVVSSGIAVGRDQTYGRLDKLVDDNLLSVHFCPATIPHVDFDGCISIQFSGLDPWTFAVPYPVHALVPRIFLVQYLPFFG